MALQSLRLVDISVQCTCHKFCVELSKSANEVLQVIWLGFSFGKYFFSQTGFWVACVSKLVNFQFKISFQYNPVNSFMMTVTSYGICQDILVSKHSVTILFKYIKLFIITILILSIYLKGLCYGIILSKLVLHIFTTE